MGGLRSIRGTVEECIQTECRAVGVLGPKETGWKDLEWIRLADGSSCGNLWTWYLAFGFCQNGDLLTARATVSLSRKPCCAGVG
jgi:hypothetical protein